MIVIILTLMNEFNSGKISNLDKFTFVDEDKKEFVGLVICYRNYLESLSEVKD